MEKAEVNRLGLIFLFDSSASQYLTLAQKMYLVFPRRGFSAYYNNWARVSYECWDTALTENSAS